VLSGLEVMSVTPPTASRSAVLPMFPLKNIPSTIRVQGHLSMRSSPASIHVIEVDVHIPRFAAFSKLPDTSTVAQPSSMVSFYVLETTARLLEWMQVFPSSYPHL